MRVQWKQVVDTTVESVQHNKGRAQALQEFRDALAAEVGGGGEECSQGGVYDTRAGGSAWHDGPACLARLKRR